MERDPRRDEIKRRRREEDATERTVKEVVRIRSCSENISLLRIRRGRKEDGQGQETESPERGGGLHFGAVGED